MPPTASTDKTTNADKVLAQRMRICNRRGLHARASARFVRTAESFDAEITVVRDGIEVGGTSIMGLMMLAAGPGASVLVQARGPEARQALEALAALIDCGFDEDSAAAGDET